MAGWGRCRRCGQRIWWGANPHDAARAFPFDDDQEQQSHFQTCAAQEWVVDILGARHQVNTCRACKARVWWGSTPNGKRRPMDVSGDRATETCHFDTCGGAADDSAADDSAAYDAAWAAARARQVDEPDSLPAIAALWLPDLGLGWPCTMGEITSSFRRLAMVHHPDMGGDASTFIRIKLAYDRLRELMGQGVLT